MIQECKVLSYNPFLNIIVVAFGDAHIQMTGNIDEGTETIYVKYDNGIATIASKEDYEKSLKPKANQKPKRVETIEEVVIQEAVVDETDIVSE